MGGGKKDKREIDKRRINTIRDMTLLSLMKENYGACLPC
jgi:hypothetical protein